MQVMTSLTAPSSPRHLPGCFFSAPTSPRRVAEFYRDFDDISTRELSSESLFIPFDWEEKPGTPKSPKNQIIAPEEDEEEDDDDVDFAFDIGDRSETASLFAEELFDGGKIKPLKPPPRLQLDEVEQFKKTSPLSSPRSPKSPLSQGKNLLRKAFSPKKKPVDVDPFEAAIENARNGSRRERGRERAQDSNRRAARSLSPYRVSAYPWEEEEEEDRERERERERKSEEESESSLNKKGSLSSASSSSLSSKSSSSRKWRLRDFLLFRSASEGRAKQKDSASILRFSSFFKKQEDVKNSSFRSNNGSGRSISPHEFHYMTKKAESKGMKKRTFLPYKQIGRFAF